MLSVCNEFLV